jgi:hypothetical protein
MFYSTTDGQYINEGTQFTIDGVTYPSGWLNQSTPEQKAALGLEEVVATNSPFNPVYYWTGETLDQATLTYTGTPKDLTEVKTNAIAQVNSTAYSILFPTDWMVVKAFETSTKVPTAWNTWRADTRTVATGAVSAIEAATDNDGVELVMNTINWPKDPDVVAAEALNAVA